MAGGRKGSTAAVCKCPDCKKEAGDETIQCSICTSWYHQNCQGVSDEKFLILADSDILWGCSHCKIDNLVSELREIHNLKKSFADLQSNFIKFQDSITAKIDSLVSAPAPQVTQSVPNFETLVKVHQEIEERREKKPRTVLFGLPEQGPGANSDRDLLEVRRLATALNLDPSSITGVFRDGQRKPGSSRILKVCWSDRDARFSFMKTVRDVRGRDQRWQNIWSRPDLTWLQRQKDHELRSEFKRRKDAGESVYISRGEIHVKVVGGNGQ